ncbi:MAG: histidinol-phosphate transaminase [Sterolibacterium sp.]|jgi:histidinol-phosphate aminotransferase|nr:histidinol-phosphate transaminase [Sterolibacterium sp.]
MSIAERAPAHIRAMTPYPPGKPITALAREMGIPVERIVKLASNENPLGMSRLARTAVDREIAGLARYPDQFELIQAIAEHHGLTTDRIILGNGSNDLLDYVARVFLGAGCSSVFSQYAFAVYPLATQGVGAESIVTPAHHFGHDLAAMRAAIRPDTRVVWIANPNNPTGTFLPAAEIRAFLKTVPADVIVVLDEAYNEYLPPALRGDSETHNTTRNWLDTFPNLIITRTFSKVYGLAGLRVGYALGAPEVIDLLNRLRQPFNVNNLALAAARAALDDHLFLAESHELNQRGLEQIIGGLKRLGLSHIPAHGNFVTFAIEDAATVNQRLLKQGIIVRPLGNYAMSEHLRVTIGLESENARFLAALEKSR